MKTNPSESSPALPQLPPGLRRSGWALAAAIFAVAAPLSASAKDALVSVVAEDPENYAVAEKRSGGIMATLKLSDKEQATQVKQYIVNFILTLKNIHEGKNPPTGEAKRKALLEARGVMYAGLDSEKLSDEQILVVKNGMSANHYRINCDAFRNLVPTLTDEEKAYVDSQFTEVCDEAVLLNSGTAKGELFVHRRGRINNYLSKRGYDLKKLSQERNARMKAGK